MGRGDEKKADQAAVDAMRSALNTLSIDGTVVIGEGERDEAPMLYIGEKVGSGGPKIDIALDPLEGTTITAKGLPNGLAVLAMAEDGNFLNAPDVYMDKIAVGGGLPDGIVDLDKTPLQNLTDLAKAKKVELSDLVVCILDRPRHAELIAKVREAGARIMLIGDGQHRERIGARLGGDRRSLERIERDVDARAAALSGADLLPDVEHRCFIALALADDDGAVERQLVERVAHGFDSGRIGSFLIASPDELGCIDGGGFGHADHFQDEQAVENGGVCGGGGHGQRDRGAIRRRPPYAGGARSEPARRARRAAFRTGKR